MNALELADELEQSALATHRSLEVATMLRQQQAEIENLEISLKNALLFIRKAQEK